MARAKAYKTMNAAYTLWASRLMGAIIRWYRSVLVAVRPSFIGRHTTVVYDVARQTKVGFRTRTWVRCCDRFGFALEVSTGKCECDDAVVERPAAKENAPGIRVLEAAPRLPPPPMMLLNHPRKAICAYVGDLKADVSALINERIVSIAGGSLTARQITAVLAANVRGAAGSGVKQGACLRVLLSDLSSHVFRDDELVGW